MNFDVNFVTLRNTVHKYKRNMGIELAKTTIKQQQNSGMAREILSDKMYLMMTLL